MLKKSRDTIFHIGCLFWLLWLAVVGGLIYVAIHFIAKFW